MSKEDSLSGLDNRPIVKKFGGSAIGNLKKMRAVCEHIKEEFGLGKKLLIVVSAMQDTTDDLLVEAKNFFGSKLTDQQRIEVDKLLVTGEQQAAAKMALVLDGFGVPAVSLTSWDIELEADSNGHVTAVRGGDVITRFLNEGKVVVVTGFQGVSVNGGIKTITTLGRGGSDVTAVCLAAALNAVCENFTDVDGIYTTDPRIVKTAKRFDIISYDQLGQMALFGGGKLMKRAISLAQKLDVKVRVLISPSVGISTGGSLVCSGGAIDSFEITESLPGLSVQNIGVITISNIPNVPGALDQIYDALIDYVLLNGIQSLMPPNSKGATISIVFSPGIENDIFASLIKFHREKMPMIKIYEARMLTALTLIDPLMEDGRGYLRDVCRSLAEVKINIEGKSAPADIIQVMVKFEDREKAALAIAQKFGLVD